MDKEFVFLSGIPRSGSQVLSSLLNQHPKLYGTTTSPLSDLASIVFDNWHRLSLPVVNPNPNQISNIVQGIFQGTYKHIEKPIIIDKNRLWPRYIKELNSCLKQRPKIICTVRDIPDVIASYILLIRKNKDKVTFIDRDLIQNNLFVNDKNRCKVILEKYINHPYTSLRIGYNSVDADLLFLDYNEIVNDSQNTLDKICDFIGIEHITANLYNLQQMDENDDYHGGLNGLHEVRSIMKKTSPPATEVLGHELYHMYKNMKLEFWKKNQVRGH